MAKEKLPASELLRLACQYATNDQESFLEAIGDTDPEAKADTEDFLNQLRAYRRKRWGKKPRVKRRINADAELGLRSISSDNQSGAG